MRSFNFDVLQRVTANGNARITNGAYYGAYWYNEARKMSRKGTAKLVLNSKHFAGYGGSTDVGYTRYNFTVTEVLG